MRYGLFSDVHANLPALDAVLAALGALGVDRYVCAGDVVGYGPHPDACVDRVAALDPVWVLGNHELMLLGRLPTAGASRLARHTIAWTRDALSAASLARLAALPLTATDGDLVVTHASLADSTTRVRSEAQAAAELEGLPRAHPQARVLVLGHTHRVLVAGARGRARWLGVRRRVTLEPGVPYVINPGSVGQARGFLCCARAAVLDTVAHTVQLVALRYDASALVRDLAAIGFPPWAHHRSPLRRFVGRVRAAVTGAAARAGGAL